MAWTTHVEISSSNNGSDAQDDHVKVSSLTFGVCGLLLFPVILVTLLLMLCVYKTYKTTLQRLVVYYIVLSLWFVFSIAVLIAMAFTVIDGRWTCNIIRYLIISSQFAWYSYITAISNFTLLLTIYLTRVRGRPLSKRTSKCVECICVISAVTIGLMVASIIEIYNYALDIECAVLGTHPFVTKLWSISLSIFFGMDLEVILVSISSCVVFCFVRQRIRNRQTAALLRNSVIHVAVNASIMGLDFFRMGSNVYSWSKISSGGPDIRVNTVLYVLWDVVFGLAIGVSVITQATICIQTSTERNTCCTRHCCVPNESQYHVIIDRKNTSAATNPASNCVSQPSYTNFAVPYTGGFTQITASVNGDGEDEQRQLIECVT